MTMQTKRAPLHGEVRWERPQLPPENREYTVSDIEKLAMYVPQPNNLRTPTEPCIPQRAVKRPRIAIARLERP